MNRRVRAKVIKAAQGGVPISKAETATAKKNEGFKEIIDPPLNIKTLMEMPDNSTILQQCIDAYKQNIVGFGVGLKYREDETKKKETPEMAAEWNFIQETLQYFHFDKPLKEVLALAVDHRERCGNGYLEIIRDGKGLPAGLENVDPSYIKVTKAGDPIEVTYKRNGKEFKRYKRFRKYIQEIQGKKTWFKEFGDARIMDSRTGQFTEDVPGEYQANEILHLKIGDGAYGIPRWIGQVIHIQGARKAEELNLNYFEKGRHIPMAVLIKNGMLTEDSETQLQEYVNSVQGVDNAHKYLLLEVEGLDEGLTSDEKSKVDIELKSLADMLQNDALFLEYDEKSRQKVQSSFRLPDIYVGRSKDFNRATADMARQITEEQVFIPERQYLAFIMNRLLLAEYDLKFVDVFFKGPDISDSQDMARLLAIYNQIGGVAPNDVRDAVSKLLGKDLENFQQEEANIPLQLQRQQQSSLPLPMMKSANADIVSILKDLRDVLEELKG